MSSLNETYLTKVLGMDEGWSTAVTAEGRVVSVIQYTVPKGTEETTLTITSDDEGFAPESGSHQKDDEFDASAADELDYFIINWDMFEDETWQMYPAGTYTWTITAGGVTLLTGTYVIE